MVVDSATRAPFTADEPAGGCIAVRWGVIESLLLATVRVSTFYGSQALTAASGFYFRRGERLFLVTSRHVLLDEASGHHPDRVELVLHTDPVNLTRTTVWSVPLYANGLSLWRQGVDSGGEIDVAVLEIDQGRLPPGIVLHAFTPEHLEPDLEQVGIGAPLLIVGFPLGFYDTVHHLPVARQAIIASAFGVRFQEKGFFLTDARTHRGASGAPVVMRHEGGDPKLPWRLLGIHSAQFDVSTREEGEDESLGLNCAWYADVLDTLTRE
jgi:S1-C subfamily serine protease